MFSIAPLLLLAAFATAQNAPCNPPNLGPPPNTPIQYGSDLSVCFGVPNNNLHNGAPLISASCSDVTSVQWRWWRIREFPISTPNTAPGGGNPFAITAGSNPGVGTKLTVSAATTGPEFTPTDDGQIQLVGTNLCIDLTDGVVGGQLQLWTCIRGNAHQSWTKPVPSPSTRIHWHGNDCLCVVAGTSQSTSTFSNGLALTLENCNIVSPTPGTFWGLSRGDTAVTVQPGGGFSFDAGLSPTSGTKMKIWTSYPGIPAQSWYYTADNRIALTGSGLCLDLPSGNTAPGTVLQLWECTTGNTNQIWTVTDYGDF